MHHVLRQNSVVGVCSYGLFKDKCWLCGYFKAFFSPFKCTNQDAAVCFPSQFIYTLSFSHLIQCYMITKWYCIQQLKSTTW